MYVYKILYFREQPSLTVEPIENARKEEKCKDLISSLVIYMSLMAYNTEN